MTADPVRASATRGLLVALIAAMAGATAPQAQPVPDEAGVRAALTACVEAWNRHQPKAFGDACLTVGSPGTELEFAL